MLQWFIWSLKFTKFTELPFHLEKTSIDVLSVLTKYYSYEFNTRPKIKRIASNESNYFLISASGLVSSMMNIDQVK